MDVRKNLELIDFTIGLYEQALKLLEPGSDDFTVLSGCILLTVGLEKMIKSVLYARNPLMILYKKIEFKDLISLEKGEKFENQSTISFEVALERLVELFPSLKKESKDIEYIVKERNFLMHNFGHIDIGKLEGKIQTKVADFTEAICKECFKSEPKNIIGQEAWSKLQNNRDAYNQAEVLGFNKRIIHLKRLLAQGQVLPCIPVLIPQDKYQACTDCPVCGEKALVVFDIDWDYDIDDETGQLLGADLSATPVTLKCDCGFTLQDYEEVEIALGDKYNNICSEAIQKYFEDEYEKPNVYIR